MKKITVILIFIILTFSIFSPALKVAGADGAAETVLRIVNDGVYFYSSPDLKEKSKLFLLTKTYFIIGVDCGDYYSVEYKKNTSAEIDGYVKKSEVEIYEDGVPNLLYPVFKAATSRSLLTFYDIDTYSPRFNESVEILNCYGKIMFNNNTYMLINYEGQFNHQGPYYVNYDDLEITEPENHPIPLKKAPDNNTGDSKNNGEGNPSNSDETVQIIIIVAVIIFAVAVVYFMFRPNNYKYKKKDDL